MSYDFNRVILTGRLGHKPELKQSKEGTPFLRMSIATDKLSKGGERTTYWHNVVAWGNQAQVCATYLDKGSPILVEGQLEVRNYQDSDGLKRTWVQVKASRIQFLGGRASSSVQDVLDTEEQATH